MIVCLPVNVAANDLQLVGGGASSSGTPSAPEVILDDQADLMSSQEEEQVRNKLLETAEETGWNLMVLTVDNAGGRQTQQVAEDYFMEHYTQDDGLVYLIDMDNREIYIATSGISIRYLTDSRVDTMLDHAFDYVGDGKYAGAFLKMLSDTQSYYRSGIQSGQYNVDQDTGEIDYYQEPEPKKVTPLEALISLIAGLFGGGALAGTVLGKYRMKTGKYHYSFRDHSELKLKGREDTLVNRFVTTRHIPRNPPPSSHSSGGHSSTTHTGSGGHTFGGGGRKF